MGNKKMKFNYNDAFKLDVQNDRPKKEEMSIEHFINLHKKFIEDKSLQGLAPRTLKEHIVNLNYFNKFVDEIKQSDKDCVAINVELFKSYLYFMIYEKNYSPYTVNIRIRTIKNYLCWLYIENYLKENVAIKLKLVKTPQDMIKPLSNSEVKKMLDACDITTYAGYRDLTSILLILDCGIRVGELCELIVSDVDLQQGLINVRAEVSKTRQFRQLPISPKTCKLLKEMISVAKENNSEFIFQSTYGGKIQKQNLILSFRRLGKKVGLEKRTTPYVFRHTFATNAVKNGVMDLMTLQRIMGHSTLITTRKYVQLETEDLKKKHRKASPIDQYFK